MAKLNYTVRTTLAPGETEPSTIPVIVDRRQPTSLTAVVENAIDRNLIAGLKPSAAEGIADGIARQLAYEFVRGRSISFGQYFYGRPYLSGTVDANGQLTSDNKINVRLYKGEDFKLTLDDFSFTFEDGGNMPKIDFVVSEGGGTRGEITAGAEIRINGRMLHLDGDTNTATFTEVGGAGQPVVVNDFTNAGPDLLSCAFPAGLVVGKKYSVVVIRTDSNGVQTRTDSKVVLVKAGATPANPPHIESGWSVGHEDEFALCYADGSGFVLQGQNLDGATVTVSSSSDQGETWANVQTVPADKLTLDGDKVTIDGAWLDVWYNNLNVGDYVKFTAANASGEDSTQRELAS